ncbi:hypothetical protein G9A89_019463 [Geosiphon pyriformis]|nr:hypothetical protein G9A89_019463 [Geosiphon pyriformis]
MIVIKENLAIFLASEYSKVADLVKKYLVRNQKTPKDLFNYLKNKSPKRSRDYILFGFSLEHGIGTIPNLTRAFLEFQNATKAKDSFGQFFSNYCYSCGIGTSQDRGKAFELYSKNTNAQYNLGVCYTNGWGTTKNEEKAFELYSKAAEAGNTNGQNCLGLSFELYSKAAEAGSLIGKIQLGAYRSRLEIKKDLELLILQFQNRGLRTPDNSKGEFLDFEAFFDQLSDEFKCLKCSNLGIIISGSPICPFCDTDKSDNNVFEAGLPKCPECFRRLKDPLWCSDCENSRFSKVWGKWNSGNDNINQYIYYTEFLKAVEAAWNGFFPTKMEFLDKVGEGGFGVVKKGSWEKGKIIFWDEKNQKYERSGVTKVALKYLKDNQNIKYINSDEFIARFKNATTDEFVIVLPFAEYGDLSAFLKMNESTLTWEMVLRILLQIAKLVHGDLHPGNILVLKSSPLKVVIADFGFCRPTNSSEPGGISGIVQYLGPEICNSSGHTTHTQRYLS